MSEQDAHDSLENADLVTFPPFIHKPGSRADVDRKKSETAPKRPRKYPDGKKMRKKNAQDLFEYVVHVVSARYDEEGQTWMYTLTDWEKKALSGETDETRLG